MTQWPPRAIFVVRGRRPRPQCRALLHFNCIIRARNLPRTFITRRLICCLSQFWLTSMLLITYETLFFLHVLEALEIRDNVTGQTEVRWKKRRGRTKVVTVTVWLKICSVSKLQIYLVLKSANERQSFWIPQDTYRAEGSQIYYFHNYDKLYVKVLLGEKN